MYSSRLWYGGMVLFLKISTDGAEPVRPRRKLFYRVLYIIDKVQMVLSNCPPFSESSVVNDDMIIDLKFIIEAIPNH